MVTHKYFFLGMRSIPMRSSLWRNPSTLDVTNAIASGNSAGYSLFSKNPLISIYLRLRGVSFLRSDCIFARIHRSI
jgi:hypothetical protein